MVGANQLAIPGSSPPVPRLDGDGLRATACAGLMVRQVKRERDAEGHALGRRVHSARSTLGISCSVSVIACGTVRAGSHITRHTPDLFCFD
jgi:hypothetical protein